MTQMIYRPQTRETTTLERQQIHKTVFKGLPCDALVVDEKQVPDYVSKGWFAHPDDMFKEPEAKPKGKK